MVVLLPFLGAVLGTNMMRQENGYFWSGFFILLVSVFEMAHTPKLMTDIYKKDNNVNCVSFETVSGRSKLLTYTVYCLIFNLNMLAKSYSQSSRMSSI
jgi:hypothetical protein